MANQVTAHILTIRLFPHRKIAIYFSIIGSVRSVIVGTMGAPVGAEQREWAADMNADDSVVERGVADIDSNNEESDDRPDFFVTNFHKWAYASRGCAALYVHPDYRALVVPPIVSAGYHDGRGTLRERFQWQGTDDITSLFTLDAAWALRQSAAFGGERAIRQRTHQLAIEGGRLIAKALGTEMLFANDINLHRRVPSMSNVRLPDLYDHPAAAGDDAVTAAAMTASMETMDRAYGQLGLHFLQHFNLYLVTFKHDGRWFLRPIPEPASQRAVALRAL